MAASNANDGDPVSKWGSLFADPQWLEIDLLHPYQVRRVKIVWAEAHSSHYQIQAWEGGAWQVRANVTADPTESELKPPQSGAAVSFVRTHVFFAGVYTSKVRLVGLTRSSGYGHSLFSFEVYADAMPPPLPPPPSPPPP